MSPEKTKLPNMGPADYLVDLAERLMHVPVEHGIDQGDVHALCEIARQLEKKRPRGEIVVTDHGCIPIGHEARYNVSLRMNKHTTRTMANVYTKRDAMKIARALGDVVTVKRSTS